MEQRLRILTSIATSLTFILGLEPHLLVVEDCIDHAVPDCLCHHVFCVLWSPSYCQLLCYISKRNLGISNVDLLQPKLQYSMLEPLNQGEVIISLEDMRILYEHLLKVLHISLFHTSDYLVVGNKHLFEVLVRKHLSVWYFSHQ